MALMVMALSEEERRRRLEMSAERLGGKALLGRALGYKDGAFVGQMIRGDRPITEKTLKALTEIRGLADLWSFSATSGFAIAQNDWNPPEEAPIQPVLLADALPVVLQALAALTPGKWRMVRARLDDLPEQPRAVPDVLADVGPALGLPSPSVVELLAQAASVETGAFIKPKDKA